MEQDILQTVFVNIICNIAAWLLIVLISLATVLWFIIARYRKLRQFFGLVGGSDRLVVYMSSLPTKGTLEDLYGNTYSPPVLTLVAAEVETMSWVSTMFSAAPLRRIPGDIKRALERFWAFRPVETVLEASPLSEAQLEFTCLLIVGGPLFNSAAKYYQEKGLSHLRFNVSHGDPKEHISVQVARSTQPQHIFQSSDQHDLAILERIVDDQHRTIVIWVAGTNPNGTKAAVHYLVTQWDNLYKHDTKGFALCIRCPTQESASNSYRKVEVKYQWSA